MGLEALALGTSYIAVTLALAVLLWRVFSRMYDQIETRFDRVDERFDRVDDRFDRVDERFDGVEGRIERVERSGRCSGRPHGHA